MSISRWPIFLAVPIAFLALPAQAQTGSLTGVVTDARTMAPVEGAVISIEDLNRRAFTDEAGRYRLADLPAGTHEVRVVYIGFTTTSRAVTIAAGENTADFGLEYDPFRLDAIVVTGQQIERQARELAYAVSNIRGEELTRARETNFVTALAGRTPGVEVTQQSGNIGASTRIVIRGIASLSGNNQPLFVVDGVPISNANIVSDPRDNERIVGAIDVGNRGADLNPDDIESVTILRGAAAAALYGQRAKNGVVLVTMKKGSRAQGQAVTASSSIRVGSPLVLPSFQNEFAQGSAGTYQATSLNGWGPRIAGQQVEDIRGETITLRPFENNVRDFYEDALLTINSVAFSAADERSDFRLGFTYQDESGIIPNSNLGRSTLNVNTGYSVKPNLHARLSGFYANTDSHGRAVQGGNDPNVLTSIINTLPRTFDIDVLRNYKDEAGKQIPIDNFNNNPFWVVNENVFSSDVERIFGNAQLSYDPVTWITVTGRTGLDYYTEDRRNINAVGTIGRETGVLGLDVIQERQLNVDLIAEARRDLSDDLHLRGVAGFNANRRELQIQLNRSSGLTVPGLYNFANADSNSPTNESEERKLYGVYGDATLGYRNYLFLNVTGRNDWSSTLPKDNHSFFYPSVNMSFVVTDAIDLQSDVLSFAKLRANWAQVGSDEAPYQLDFRFFPVDNYFGQFGTGGTFPFGGRTGFEATNTIPPSDLKPQIKTAFEVGGEFQFWEGRAGLDLTYYDERIEDQILSIPIPQSTGFAFNRTNIGEVSNKGIEAQVNLSPIRTGSIDWNMLLNFTRNRNRVESLAPGVTELVIESGFNSLQIKAEPGKSFGIYGPGWLRHEGQVVIDSLTGLRREGPIRRLGDVDPDFRISLTNSIGINRLYFSFLLDWRKGGDIFSQTVGQLRRLGLAEETAVNRDGTFIDEGVIATATDSDGNITASRPNDVPVQNMQAFWQRYAASTVHEGNMFDASNARLREVRLDYTVPGEWLGNLPISSLTVGFEARNLFLLYKKIPHIDPEVGLFGSASDGQGVEWDVLPSTRSFGMNVQVRF